ncbi:MAG: hypothetical protein EPN91_05425 [Salinibacterium sp.]|nr:MAG: hypothetical protein EPN91_05425 [Salinibacterium sp.]
MGAKASTRGPVPKRASERAGHRAKDDVPDQVKVNGPVPQPPADREWAPAAKRWYSSLAQSGQANYFEPSDWEEARLVADLLSGQLKTGATYKSLLSAARKLLDSLGRFALEQDDETRLEIVVQDLPVLIRLINRLSAPPNAAMIKEILKAMADLGTTEGSRRRLRIEVEREPDEPEEHELPGLTVLTGGK